MDISNLVGFGKQDVQTQGLYTLEIWIKAGGNKVNSFHRVNGILYQVHTKESRLPAVLFYTPIVLT